MPKLQAEKTRTKPARETHVSRAGRMANTPRKIHFSATKEHKVHKEVFTRALLT